MGPHTTALTPGPSPSKRNRPHPWPLSLQQVGGRGGEVVSLFHQHHLTDHDLAVVAEAV